MPVDVILGLQWGDEGKGKLVDMLAEKYQLIARFQGGPNAGHTLYMDNQAYVLHQIPSGVLQTESKNLIGDGVVLDPSALQKEIAYLKKIAPTALSRLYIARGAHLILPIHAALDEREEAYRGKQKIGSTGKGVGPCYQDKYARRGLQVADLADTARAKAKYNSLKKWHAPYLDKIDTLAEEAFWEDAAALQQLQIVDGGIFVEQALQADQQVLAEGAQGTLLDIDHGTYPYVTSSHTSIGGVCTGLGVSPKKIGHVYGVSKAYCTRVGEGPFPSEERGAAGEILSERGHEFGSTTGRKRRCGWLDLAALRYAVVCNGVDTLLLTKVDVLAGMEEIKLCVGYQAQRGKHISKLQRPTAGLQPHYLQLPGWSTHTDYSNNKQWPTALYSFLAHIETEGGVPIAGFSYGKGRKEFVAREQEKSNATTL